MDAGDVVVGLVVAALILLALWAATKSARAGAASPRGGRNIVVKTVKGDKKAQREIERMLSRGYRLDGHVVSQGFTAKQRHTLTFMRT